MLLPLLAALALPTAIKTESIWLLLTYAGHSSKAGVFSAIKKIEMKDLSECQKWEINGAAVGSSKVLGVLMVNKFNKSSRHLS